MLVQCIYQKAPEDDEKLLFILIYNSLLFISNHYASSNIVVVCSTAMSIDYHQYVCNLTYRRTVTRNFTLLKNSAIFHYLKIEFVKCS
jgi:hypothetical protein